MKNLTKNLTALMAGAAMVLTPALVSAQINYGDFMGNTVEFIQVTEDAISADDTPPLYGAPTVSGNTLDFDPVGFGAASSGGGAPDITDGNLVLDVYAKNGFFIDEIEFEEEGDFTMAGTGTDSTFVDVTATFRFEIYEVDGVLIDPVQQTVFMSFLPNADGTFQLFTDGGGGPFYQGDWTGKVNFDLDAMLTAANVPYEKGATKVSLDIDNILTAGSEENTSSAIAKKDFQGFAITIIPEPSTAALGLMGLLGLVATLRRRK